MVETDKPVDVPAYLVQFSRRHGKAGAAWLERLPGLVGALSRRWEVELAAPLGDPPAAAGWLAPGRRPDGARVMMKIGWPHPEAAPEAAGLRAFAGCGAARLVASDAAEFAVLTELVEPGDDLWSLSLEEADVVAAAVLRLLWGAARPSSDVIPTLASEVAAWLAGLDRRRGDYPDDVLGAARRRGEALAATEDEVVVVHGDFNPSNVLRSAERGWLAIDPKPLVGDPAYDLAQYLFNRVAAAELQTDPLSALVDQVHRMAELVDVDPRRVAGWAAVKAVAWDWGPANATLMAAVADRLESH